MPTPITAGLGNAGPANAGLDTALTQLAMHHGRLSMEGQTTAAATRLIAAVAARPPVRDPAFTAPVVRGDVGNEIFSLQTDLAR